MRKHRSQICFANADVLINSIIHVTINQHYRPRIFITELLCCLLNFFFKFLHIFPGRRDMQKMKGSVELSNKRHEDPQLLLEVLQIAGINHVFKSPKLSFVWNSQYWLL